MRFCSHSDVHFELLHACMRKRIELVILCESELLAICVNKQLNNIYFIYTENCGTESYVTAHK